VGLRGLKGEGTLGFYGEKTFCAAKRPRKRGVGKTRKRGLGQVARGCTILKRKS